MILLIDNYDSFTFNIVQFLGDLGVHTQVVRHDKITVDEVFAPTPPTPPPTAIILSPGPCTPDQAGICLDLVRQAPATLPILGICLGHQTIGQAFGGKIIRAPKIMHGKISAIQHHGQGVFDGLAENYTATRYHSLIVERESLPDCLTISAQTQDGIIMGLTHKTRPVYGVQFHPESIASQYGHELLANFLKIAGLKPKPTPPHFTNLASELTKVLPQ